jgi:hypothetical protein
VYRAQVLQLSILLWSSRVSRSLALAAVLRLSARFIDSLLVEAAQLIRDSALVFVAFHTAGIVLETSDQRIKLS